MNPNRTRIVLAAALAMCAVSLIAPLPGYPRQISAFLALFYIPGLLFLLAAGDVKRPALDTVFVPLLISPILVSIALVALARAGLGLRGASMLCAAAALVLAFAASLRARTHREQEPSAARIALAVSVGFAAIVAASYLANRFLIVRSDAWYHGCVVSDILERGMPPMEPGFPDVPIRYMWFYHAFNAAWKELSGLSVFPALAVFNVVNAFAFPYLMARLAAVFFSERRFILATALLAVVGLDSATWILWPLNFASAFTGEIRGIAEVTRIARAVELDNAGVIDFLRSPWTWMVSTPDKHFTITAFSYALNLFVFAFLTARDAAFGARSPVKRLLSLLVAMIGALFFHVIVGAALLASAAGAALLALAARATRRSSPLPRREIAALLGASALTLAAGVPYLRSLVGGGDGGAGLGGYFHIGLTNVLTIAVPLLVLFPASRRAARALAPSGLDGWMLLLWLAPLGALNAAVNLPTVNESKLVFPFFLLIVPFVARELAAWLERARGGRRAIAAAWLAALFAVPFVLTIRGFLLDGPRDDCTRKRYVVTSAERELYDWINASTPIRAAIITRATCTITPVYAGRRSFVPSPKTITVDGYAGPKVDLYTRIHADLFSGAADLDADLAGLAGTGNDYYLVLWGEDRAVDSPLERLIERRPKSFETVFENDAGAVHAIRTIGLQKGEPHR